MIPVMYLHVSPSDSRSGDIFAKIPEIYNDGVFKYALATSSVIGGGDDVQIVNRDKVIKYLKDNGLTYKLVPGSYTRNGELLLIPQEVLDYIKITVEYNNTKTWPSEFCNLYLLVRDIKWV